MTNEDFSMAFALLFIQRADALGYKGVKRDNAALDFYCGAATALAATTGDTVARARSNMLEKQARMLVSVRGYIAVMELSKPAKIAA